MAAADGADLHDVIGRIHYTTRYRERDETPLHVNKYICLPRQERQEYRFIRAPP